MKKTLICAVLVLMLLCSTAFADTLKMASSIDFAPYEYYEGEEIVGIDVEIAQAVCDALGYELVIEDVQFDSIITGVVKGKYDFGMSGFTITEERKLKVDFSTPYTTTAQKIIVPEDSTITSVDDLYNTENSFTIVVQQGTTGDLYITDDVETKGLKHDVQPFNKAPDAVAALLAGKADCMIIDGEVADSFVEANEGLKVLDAAYAYEEYAICFAKDSEIYDAFNTELEKLIADGTVQSIIDKYITED